MNRVSLEKAKSFANIYFPEKDDEVERLVASAEKYLANFLGYPDLSQPELVINWGSPPPDSPGVEQLEPDVEHLVLMLFANSWQLRETQVTGTIVSENPEWIRMAHLRRRGLGV